MEQAPGITQYWLLPHGPRKVSVHYLRCPLVSTPHPVQEQLAEDTLAGTDSDSPVPEHPRPVSWLPEAQEEAAAAF